MKIKINAASGDLKQYASLLSKYNFEQKEDDNYGREEGTIEVRNLEEILVLAEEVCKISKERKEGLVINKNGNVTIYDDWLE